VMLVLGAKEGWCMLHMWSAVLHMLIFCSSCVSFIIFILKDLLHVNDICCIHAIPLLKMLLILLVTSVLVYACISFITQQS
jgi:hypothetical protein